MIKTKKMEDNPKFENYRWQNIIKKTTKNGLIYVCRSNLTLLGSLERAAFGENHCDCNCCCFGGKVRSTPSFEFDSETGVWQMENNVRMTIKTRLPTPLYSPITTTVCNKVMHKNNLFNLSYKGDSVPTIQHTGYNQ